MVAYGVKQATFHLLLLEALARLNAQFRADASLDRHTRLSRDRAIGRELAALAPHRRRQLLAWLERTAGDAARAESQRLITGLRLITLLMVVLGLAAGWGSAAALFHYDGSQPVNVVHILAVFVGLQWLLLAAFVLALAPGALTGRVPGIGAIQRFLADLRPGRLAALAARHLPAPLRDAFANLTALGHPGMDRVKRWLIANWSQRFAVAFNLGALAGALYLVAFTDLAFGWSTTLDLGAERFHRLIQWLAFPWHALLPQAVPSLELVQATRFFRLDHGLLAGAANSIDPALLGQWWRFILTALLIYGLLPRLVTASVATRRLAIAAGAAFDAYPGVADLYGDLNAPLVETTGIDAKSGTTAPGAAVQLAAAIRPVAGAADLIIWADAANRAALGPLLERAGVRQPRWYAAGGGASLDQDAAVVRELARQITADPVVLIVKAWEPPLLECTDFLAEIRVAVGPGRALRVVPIGRAADATPAVAATIEIDTWRQALGRLTDPQLSIVATACA